MRFGSYELAVRYALRKAIKEKGRPLTPEEIRAIKDSIPLFYKKEAT